MAATLPVWCSNNPSALLKPDDGLVNNGFKSSTVGNNFWLNYILNQLTTHSQIPVGLIKNSLAASMAGYLPLDGSTFGKATSGATYANNDYLSLFVLLWDNVTITPGKGASAIADWNANKTATLPDSRGSQLRGAKSTDTLLSVYNSTAEKVTLDINTMPVMQPSVNDPEHNHITDIIGRKAANSAVADWYAPELNVTSGDITATTTSRPAPAGITIDPVAGDPTNQPNAAPHNNVQPVMIVNWFVKY